MQVSCKNMLVCPCASWNTYQAWQHEKPIFQFSYAPVQILTQQIEVDIDVQTTQKPSKQFSAGPFGQLKNLEKCFRQIRSDGQLKNLQKYFWQICSDSRKTCRKPSFSHDRAESHSKRRAGCESKRRAGSQSKRQAGSHSERANT